MAEHFLNLPDAQTIHTREYALTAIAVRDVVANRAMGLIHGDAGLGKTFAVAAALEQLTVPYSQHEFAGKPNTRTIAVGLLRGLEGITHDGTRERIEVDLLDALGDRDHLFSIDEAQRLTHDPVEYLRYIYDHPGTRCSILLVGGNGTWKLLRGYPMLRSRIYRRVEFRRLSVERILEYIPAFHPIYRDATPKLIAGIDDAFGHGNLRNWAALTNTLVNLMREYERPLDRELVQNALALHGEE
jgi:DNA transposition AAA+ family ATPase